MEEDWECWVKLIRSTLLSSKKPLTPREINRDIKEIDGRNIPYRQMNYSSLEEMLKDISGLKVLQLNGETVVQAMANEKTSHIQKMVKRQKKPKKKRTLPRASNTFYTSKAPTTKQTPVNTKNATSASINRLCNQDRSHNLSSQTSFTPKITSTPTSVSRKPVQISQHHQQQACSFKKNVQSIPKPNLQPKLTPSERLLAALMNSVPDSVRSHQLPSEKSHRVPIKLESQGRHVISHPIVDPRTVLNTYCESRQLPKPVYKDLPIKRKSIYSYVMVNSKKYSSYPKEAKSKDEAEKLAAEAALKELTKDNKESTIVTSDRDLVIKRIVDTVNVHPSGLFEASVVELYVAQYNESLPSDWLKLVEHLIHVDVGVSDFTILSPANYNTNIKAHTVTLLEPENLKLSAMDEFWLQVYNVDNTTSIWGLIIDENHSDKVDELAQEMKVHYDKEKSKALLVVPGKHYAVFDSEWHRVRCIKLDEENKAATVFFIDRGDEDVFLTSRLRVLHSKFCRLPAQAVRISLAGLEIFEDYKKAQTLLEELLVDNSVYLKIIKKNKSEMVRYTGVLSAELFLERDGEEINVNRFLRSEILNKVVNPLEFLGPEKVAQEVHISYVDKSAIFIQLKSQGMKLLKTLLKKLTKEHLKPVLKFDSSKMYIADIKDEWQRVKIVKIENENTVQVLCVDIGNILTLKRNNLFLPYELFEILAVYPKQAVQVCLHKISPLMFNEKMADRLRDLAPKTDVFYVKVVGNIQDFPMVEFYKRTDNNYLASLNDTLALESEIMSSRNNNNSQSHRRSDQSSVDAYSEFPLKAPAVPPIGSLFEVHVTMAAHPGNFKIQKVKSLNELETLEEELSRYCESYSDSSLTFNSIKVGNVCAAKFDKADRWYRAYVSKIISKITCVIYFCDYGNYKEVPINELRPLKNQFYDLPYQAIKATLYGVMPKLNDDWTINDSYRLNELITDKNFFALIKSCEKESMSGEMILGLELIDTSTAKDIFIREVLISENRADGSTE